MDDATAKSTSPARTAATGMMRRGKKTFVISCLLLTRLADDSVNDDANSCHGKRPLYANSEYGTPSDEIFASRPRKIVKTIIVATGWRIAHAPPSTVCL